MPDEYTVAQGDNLYDICQRFYGNGEYSSKLAELNKINKEQTLSVGQKLTIPDSIFVEDTKNKSENITPLKRIERKKQVCEDDDQLPSRIHPEKAKIVKKDFLYKAVTPARLTLDLRENKLPVGIRTGSATAIALATSGRKATDLDSWTLWFGIQEVAMGYMENQPGSILLQIDLNGHPLWKLGNDFYTDTPVEWNKVKYKKEDKTWSPIGSELPRDAWTIDSDDDSEGDEDSDPDW